MSKAAIIGGGVIGGAWAARFLLNGWDVALFDPAPGGARKMEEVLANARRALPMLYDVALPPEGRLTHAPTIEAAVAGADWVQESVPERLDLKHAVLAQIEAAAAPDAIIGSSTSGFTPTQLRQGARHPGRIMVAHPFNPVYLLPLVELVAGDADEALVAHAMDTLRGIGMHPLRVRAEIDAHIADRLLESVWREALWLIKDGIATTEEIDDAIHYGFGIRWAQMGLFETYRIAGGEAGMKHFIAQFGPCLQWPWSRLTDVPDLTEDLVDTIAAQSDAQSGEHSIRELERIRDDNLVVMMRALKGRNAAAGALIRGHEAALTPAMAAAAPMVTVARTVPIDWIDINGHMNEGRYGQIFSDAAEAVMAHIGADPDYIAGGLSFFTVETSVKYLMETHAGEAVRVESRVTEGRGKKLRVFHDMRREADGHLLATCDQLMLHVSLETRRTCDPGPAMQARIAALAALHAEAPR